MLPVAAPVEPCRTTLPASPGRPISLDLLQQRPQPVHGTGPLAVWRALAVNRNGNRWQVGLTADGWDLLEIVEGMTIEQPPDADVAARFLAHIFRIHPGERWGFTHLLQVLGSDNVGRAELAIAFAQARDWSKSVAERAEDSDGSSCPGGRTRYACR